jgi:hypothetical protein
VNLYLELGAPGTGKAPAWLVGTPGLRRFCTLPSMFGCRGAFTAGNGRAFVCCGPELWEVFAGGTYKSRGTLATSVGPVSMADNGLQLIVVDGSTAGYLLVFESGLMAPIGDPDFVGGDVVVFLDGYFITNAPGTDQFYISGLLDGNAWNASEASSAEGRADPIRSLIADHRELLVFGSMTAQPFTNTANIDFPLEPLGGTLIEQGCAAAFSTASIDNTTYWLSQDGRGSGQVFKLAGYTPQRVSTHAIETAIASYARIDDATAYTYQQDGHSFYVLSFPTGNATWVYDIATQLWHRRAALDPATGQWQRHAAQYHAFAFGLHLVCGDGDSRVYSAELTQYTDDGLPLVRERAAPYLHDNLKLLYPSVFELDCEHGTGLDGGVEPGTTPKLMLQWTNNGHTWSTERWVTAGAQGQYNARAIWRRLGRHRQRAYRVRQSDPCKVAWLAARVEF